MNKSEDITELSAAFCQFQAEVQDPTKNRQGYGYKYAELQPILEMFRPLLHKYGLSIIQLPGEEHDKITVETILLHKSGQWISGITGMKFSQLNKMNEPQSAGSIITYARRYAYSAMIGIAAMEDTDANTGHDTDRNVSKKPTQPQSKPQQIVNKPVPQITHDNSNKKTLLTRNAPTMQEVTLLKNLLNNDETKINNILQWAGIKSFDEMSRDAYQKAVNGIQEKIAKASQQ